MRPELFHIGPIVIYSYGFMLGVAFLLANWLLTNELKRRNLDPAHATMITFLALIGGVIGAKLFHVLENWNEFLAEPMKTALSSGGLTWYGGFIVALVIIAVYLRRKKIPFLLLADMTAPGLAIGYGIARIGCQLAGDGDYGCPTSLPWAMSYEYGTVPTAFRLENPMDPHSLRIPTEWVHPAPLYELGLAILVFTFLFRRRARPMPIGNQFGWFLILHSLCRFVVEIIRINPELFLGMSQAQVISLVLIGWGAYLVRRTSDAGGARLRQAR